MTTSYVNGHGSDICSKPNVGPDLAGIWSNMASYLGVSIRSIKMQAVHTILSHWKGFLLPMESP